MCVVPSTALLLTHHHLSELNLEWCRIGDDSAFEMARAIHANSTLKKLDLRGNPVRELVESLVHNPNIQFV